LWSGRYDSNFLVSKCKSNVQPSFFISNTKDNKSFFCFRVSEVDKCFYWFVKKNMFAFPERDAMFFPVFFFVMFVPVKLYRFNSTEFDHNCT